MTRIRIDPRVAAEVLFLSNRTCCVCREPGKPFQIHHIDENPANNDPENFAVLCFDCHDKTQVRGGFGRGLDAAQVTQFRNDWLQRIQHRREQADCIAAEAMAGARAAEGEDNALEIRVSEAVGVSESLSTVTAEGQTVVRSRVPIEGYVRTLPELRRRAYDAARPDWDSGVTATMVEGSYRVIDVMQEILVTLAGYYPLGHFDTENPKDYISELIATRYRWHRYHCEPDGHGRNGTIVSIMVAGATMDDVKHMVTDMVRSLAEEWPGFFAWRTEWERE